MKNIFNIINPWINIKTLHTNLRGDILAGITVAIIALPMALSFGKLSGLGVYAGIWGAIAGGIVGGLFGGCLVGVSGPTTPKALQIKAYYASSILFVGASTHDEKSIALFSIIFFSGIILLIISMFNISRFIHYIPYPVVAGFMCGIGVLVVLGQINDFTGIEESKVPLKSIFESLQYSINNIKNTKPDALCISILSLFILFVWNPIVKNIRYLSSIPAPLIVVIIGTLICQVMDIKIATILDYMIKNNNVDSMIKNNDKEIFKFYYPEFKVQYIGPAFALAGLAIIDSLLSCKVADNMTGTRHSSDRETFGQGMANMVAGLIGGVTTATATMRTVANIKFGAKTPLASIIHGLTLLAILYGLGTLVEAIPLACLAAILFKVGIDILDYRILPILKKLPINDFLVFIIVLFITVFSDLMIAVTIGVLFSILQSFKAIKTSFRMTSNHKVIPFAESKFFVKEAPKEIIVLQPSGPLFFGSLESLIKVYNSATSHKMVIIDMSLIDTIDLSGIYGIEDLIKSAEMKNVKVIVTKINPHIKNLLVKLNFVGNIGQNNYIESEEVMNKLILDLDKS